jgi:hypothetical protein
MNRAGDQSTNIVFNVVLIILIKVWFYELYQQKVERSFRQMDQKYSIIFS